MTSKEIVRTLILYAQHKKNAEERPGSYSSLLASNRVASLRRELVKEGVSEEFLDMSGHDLEVRIYESIASQIKQQ